MGLTDVYNVIQTTVTNAINTTGIPNAGQVVIGWPLSTELVEILGQPDEEYQVSIYMTTSRKATRYIEPPLPLVAPAPGLSCVVSGSTITFTGSALTVVNIHTFLKGYPEDVFIQMPIGSSVNTIALAVANAITNAPNQATASANGAVVTIDTGEQVLYCNIGGSTALLQEVARLDATIQVTIWTPGNASGLPLAYALADSIKSQVGIVGSHRYTLPDGSSLYLAFRQDELNDLSQSSYACYQYILIFDAEYGTIASTPATQVGGIVSTQQIDNFNPSTIAFGGS